MRFKILKRGGYGSAGISEGGGNMSGPVVLFRDPQLNLEAASKGYVDTALGNLNGVSLITGTIPAERFPAFSGDIANAVGTSVFDLSLTGVTPATYPKVTVNGKGRITNGYLLAESDLPALDWSKVTTGKPSTIAGYGITDAIAPTGGTMTGDLIINNSPTAALHVATKGYVDAIVAGSVSGSFKAGDIVRKTTSTTPTGFLRANGGDVSKTTYSALYAVLGDGFSFTNTPGAGMPWSSQYDFNNADQETLSWSQTAGPAPVNGGTLINSQSFITKNRAYIFGGRPIGGSGGASYTAELWTAVINANGTLGAWTVSTAFPTTIGMGKCVVTKNKVYVIGGVLSNGNSPTMYGAPINADGTLGTWVYTGSLPVHVRGISTVVIKNKLYIFAGVGDVDVRGKIYRCDIDSNGDLVSWVTINNGYPYLGSNVGAAVIKNYLYVFGGQTNSGSTNVIYYAPINSDGTLGTWVLSNVTLYMPTSNELQVFVTKKYLYVINGLYVMRHVINADGTLQAGIHDSTITGASEGTGFITSNYIHFYGSTSTTALFRSAFAGGMNDFSTYYAGTITATDPNNFRLPDYSSKEMPGSYTYIKF